MNRKDGKFQMPSFNCFKNVDGF